MTTQITPTEADRKAAAKFARDAWHLFWPDDYKQAMQDAANMEAGQCDNWELVQAFARHAASARAEALEEAARALRLRQGLYGGEPMTENEAAIARSMLAAVEAIERSAA